MSKQNNKQHNKKQQKQKKNANAIVSVNDPRFIPRPRNLCVGFPRQDTVKLRYSTDFSILDASATFEWTYRLLTGAYDPDDGGAANPRNYTYFNNLAQVYDSYQVLRVETRLTITNKENFPVTFCYCASPFDLTTDITTGANIQDFSEQPYKGKAVLGPEDGQGRSIRSNDWIMYEITGDPYRYKQDQYRGFYNANPSFPFYHFMGIFADANLTNGVQVSLEYQATIKFDTLNCLITQQTVPRPNRRGHDRQNTRSPFAKWRENADVKKKMRYEVLGLKFSS